MTFLEVLQSHKGGLLRLKSELYWYGGRGWDGAPGRICLLLDAGGGAAHAAAAVATAGAAAAAGALLLIDGAPHWVWVAQEDVEVL